MVVMSSRRVRWAGDPTSNARERPNWSCTVPCEPRPKECKQPLFHRPALVRMHVLLFVLSLGMHQSSPSALNRGIRKPLALRRDRTLPTSGAGHGRCIVSRIACTDVMKRVRRTHSLVSPSRIPTPFGVIRARTERAIRSWRWRKASCATGYPLR